MSSVILRAQKVLWVSRRAARALLKYGPVGVFSFAYEKLSSRGLRWSFAFAFAGPEARRELLAQPIPPRRASLRGRANPVTIVQANTPPRAIELDESYSISSAVWDSFIGPLFEQRLFSKLGDVQAEPSFKLWVIVDCHSAAQDDICRTLSSISEMRRAAEFPIEVALLGASAGDYNLDGAGYADEEVTFSQSIKQISGSIRSSDYLLWLVAGDAPRPESSLALKLSFDERYQVYSFDGYYYSEDRVHPVLHPGVNAIHILNVDYLLSRVIFRADTYAQFIEGASPDRPIAALRNFVVEHIRAGRRLPWSHIAIPIVHLKVSHEEILETRRRLIVSDEPLKTGFASKRAAAKSVAVVICTKDKGLLLRQLIRSCISSSRDLIKEIVIVTNNTSNPIAIRTLEQLKDVRDVNIKILKYDAPFNFSAQSNIGFANTTAEYCLLLNDDIVPVTPDWLSRLLEPFNDPAVGLSAPLLVYPDERVQHCGMYLGLRGVAGHSLRFAALPDGDYLFYATAPREVSSLTGAALLISRRCYSSLNGLDEFLASYLQDVDFSLRARFSGFKAIYTPRSILIHMESASVNQHIASHEVQENRGREHARFYHRWRHVLRSDEFHNPIFDIEDESMKRLVADSGS